MADTMDAQARQLEIRTGTGASPSFSVASADRQSNIADASIDLAISATACHYFSAPAWWNEMARVVKPGGTVAVWCVAGSCRR